MYHQPHAVFADVRLMQTLPTAELRSGLCEATKNCLAIRPTALPVLSGILRSGAWATEDTLLWLLRESLAAKMQVTASDTREQRAGLVLEYGHTIGHALELCDHRLRGAEGVSHGEAIAMGMRVAARISATMGLLSTADLLLHDELVSALGVPSALPGISADEVLAVVRADNKRGYIDLTASQAAMVLLEAPGKPLGPRDLPLVPVAMDLIHQHVADTLTVEARC
jgi:3-dehydroquinate synthase/2-deoxy-scyllo-inosose synthase